MFCRFLVLVVLEAGAGDEGAEPILQLETGGHTASCWWLDFTPDGQQLVSVGHDKVIRVWDIRDPAAPRLDRSLRLQIGPGHEGKLFTGAISPDGRSLAVGGYPVDWRDGCSFFLFDLTTGRILTVLRGHTSTILGLAFAPDGRYLASGSHDKTVRVCDSAATPFCPAADKSWSGRASI